MLLLPGLSLCALVATATPVPLAAQTLPPLIERARLFGNPSKVQARLSPDGKWISWIAPRDGVLNIWVAPFGDPTNARPLTAETTRPIRRSEEHTSELQSPMRISYAVFCLKKKNNNNSDTTH